MLAAGMMLGGRPRYTITLGSNRSEWRKSLDAAYIPSSLAVDLTLVVNPNIEVQSTSPYLGALHFDGLAAGSQVHVVNYGYLLGRGGAGGDSGSSGWPGGPAIRADFSGLLQITNASGYVWGGGGGGGGGGMCAVWMPGDLAYDPHLYGGGGGAGAGGGVGGVGTGLASDGSASTTGRLGAAGAGGAGGDGSAGTGGTGGAWGTAGAVGGTGTRHGGGADGSSYDAGAAGGAGGYAILLNAGTVVSWLSGESRIAGSVGT